MRKIPTLFLRDETNRSLVRNEVNPDAAWVLAGEGTPTRKWDGSCCLIRDGKLYKRYEVKAGKTPPPDFEPATDVDPETGKQQGWVPVGDGPEDRWHRDAFEALAPLQGDGTYELIGPKVQGNPERWPVHVLLAHGKKVLPDAPRDFDGLKDYLARTDIEGIVWWHPDGRMAKAKARDFGVRR